MNINFKNEAKIESHDLTPIRVKCVKFRVRPRIEVRTNLWIIQI